MEKNMYICPKMIKYYQRKAKKTRKHFLKKEFYEVFTGLKTIRFLEFTRKIRNFKKISFNLKKNSKIKLLINKLLKFFPLFCTK